VLWTPQGYYTGSPGADKIVGWQINKWSDQVPDYVGAKQLRRHLNRPDIVEKAIIVASVEHAVRESPGANLKLTDLLARSVPQFKIGVPAANAIASQGRTAVKSSSRPPRIPSRHSACRSRAGKSSNRRPTSAQRDFRRAHPRRAAGQGPQ
jgi:hypothetical protein